MLRLNARRFWLRGGRLGSFWALPTAFRVLGGGMLVALVWLVTGAAVSAQDRNQRLYPALQRELGDPALIERGRAVYGISCRACHGLDLRGGDLGGPNLLRSQLVLRDEAGELIAPVIREGQTGAGDSVMPPQSLAEPDVEAVVAYVHDVLSTASRQGGPPLVGDETVLDILVGDATAGQIYFAERCASCHSVSGDLAGIATRIPEPKELQNSWVRGGGRNAEAPPIAVTVTLTSGESVEGHLERFHDFLVVLTDHEGRHRSFGRRGDTPTVELDDPMAAHRQMLPFYRDADIHNVTAYLVTLK